MGSETETLRYLAGAYFHQDYDLIAETPSGNVEDFISNETDETSALLYGELQTLLSRGVSESDAQRIWLVDGRASYDPRYHGKSYVGWLTEISDLLRDRLAGR
ncbi:contact-dependent growth inhibition system immunity protein [Micromonospora chersina]